MRRPRAALPSTSLQSVVPSEPPALLPAATHTALAQRTLHSLNWLHTNTTTNSTACVCRPVYSASFLIDCHLIFASQSPGVHMHMVFIVG